MPWKIRIFFYFSLGFLLYGLIFPTHVSQAIGFDVGDMVHWIYGFYILIPRNPTEEIRLYFTINIQCYFLIINAIILVAVCFVKLRNAKLGIRYEKNLIYAIAILLLIVLQFYQLSGFIVMRLSSYGFFYCAIFAMIGGKELNVFYIDKGIVNAKNERTLGVALIIISLVSFVYTISMVLLFAVPYGIDVLSLSDAINLFSGLILLLIMLFYGINSLIRAKRKNKSKLQS